MGVLITNQIIFTKEQYKVLSLRLKKRILIRLLLITCMAIVQKLVVFKITNTLAVWCVLVAFIAMGLDFVQAVNTFVKFLQNKITFVQIGKHFKVRFFDSKVEGATHYFKETFYCRILIKLDVNSGGEKYRR